ncbi:MAG: ribosome biogenesis GTPase Der [Bacteroidetes bacterium]|nr:ribosome biogenesis GTPase Der [Bacteroidota bacterium]
MANIVAIIGRPNVGKSTLFNRLIEEKKAIVDNQSGITRDRLYGTVEWNGKEFTIIDTGGFVPNSDDVFEKEILKQVKIAAEEATLILFMVDVSTGITDLDDKLSRFLRKTNKPTLMVVNKVDNHSRLLEANEFYKFGIGEELLPIAAISGSGTGELLDRLTKMLPEAESSQYDHLPKFTIVGRPNVGKSSFLNTLVGYERNIVTEIAGTTRDAIHTHYNHFGKEFVLIDTAGIRKKASVKENIEFYSIIRAIKAIDDSDVCFLLIDAVVGIESPDLEIVRKIISAKKGLVLLANKWDLVDKETNSAKEYEKKYRSQLEPFVDLPILFISATEKQRVFKAVEIALEVYERRKTRISTSKLNDVMLGEINHTPPPSVKGKFVKIKYITQLKTHTPTFVFFCNLPQYLRTSYKRFLENKLRKHFDLEGVPIALVFRKK